MVVERQIGDWIAGRYQIYDIHLGGMGVVYIVYDHSGVAGQRVLALKTLRDRFLNESKQIARFHTECTTWINLERHPNIVRAYSIQEMEGKPFVVMELVTGGDLRRWIKTPRLDLPQVLRFGVQFCLGMEHADKKGLTCHRDIKPENLLITEGATLKITDFGLAKVREEIIAEERASNKPIKGDWFEESKDIPVKNSEVGAPARPNRAVDTEFEAIPVSPAALPFENTNGFERDDEVDRALAEAARLADTRPDLGSDVETIDQLPAPPGGIDPRDQATIDAPGHSGPFPAGSNNPTQDWGRGAADETGPDSSDPTNRPVMPWSDRSWRSRGMPDLRRQEITEANTILGTAAYMAPEQAIDAKSVDIRADIYSFGVVLFEMIVGERPFKGDTLDKLKWQHAHTVPPPFVDRIPRRFSKVAKRVDYIVRRCLEKDVSKRYSTIFELRQDLAVALRKLTGEKLQAPTPAELEAWELTSKGVSLGTLGRFDEERDSYEDSFLIKPDYVPSWFNQSAALGSQGKWTEAVEFADVALLLNPASVPALINKGLALLALGKSDEAMKHFDAAVHIQPRDPEV